MVQRARVSGPTRPDQSDFVVMAKEGIKGQTRVHRRAFEKTWEPKGWQLVTDDPAETDVENGAPDTAEAPQDAPPVVATPDNAPQAEATARRTPRAAAKTDIVTSEES